MKELGDVQVSEQTDPSHQQVNRPDLYSKVRRKFEIDFP